MEMAWSRARQTNRSAAVRDFDQQIISEALGRFEGEIAIVWDRPLIRQFNVLVSPPILAKNHNVTKNFSLQTEFVVGPQICHVVYFLVPLATSVDKLIKNFPLKQAETSKYIEFHVFFVPETNFVLEQRLRAQETIWRRIGARVFSLACHWYPDDQLNFVHMALPQLPDRMLIDGDWNFLYKCALALAQLKRRLIRPSGKPLNVYCKGEWSARIVEMLKKMGNQSGDDSKENNSVSISAVELSPTAQLEVDTIVIMDRWLDLIAPMLTQFTLGGAIDEFFGIDVQGKTGITRAMLEDEEDGQAGSTSTTADTPNPKDFISLSGDVHEQLHDLHILAVAKEIGDLVKEMHEAKQNRTTLESIAEYKNFVQQMPQILQRNKSVDLFTAIGTLIHRRISDNFFMDAVSCEREIFNSMLANGSGEKANAFIESAIIEARPPCAVLRLIALQSLTAAKGLRPQVINTYRKLFVQSYGIFALRWWIRLQMAGILREGASSTDRRLEQRYPSTNYAPISRRFRLLCPEVDEIKYSDSAYALNGRASLLLRYLEEGLEGNWREFIKVEGLYSGSDAMLTVDDVSANGDVAAETVEVSSPSAVAALSASLSSMAFGGARAVPTQSQKSRASPSKLLVFVVGGMTRAEIGALRKVHGDRVVLIASTAVITAKSLLESFK